VWGDGSIGGYEVPRLFASKDERFFNGTPTVKNPNQSQNMFITASESSKDERFFNGTL
jgi:hypothetical protein